MCFLLYAATTKPLPRRAWEQDSPNLSVKSLASDEVAIKSHFSNPEVQFIGSTSGCGCDFPHEFIHDGTWLYSDEDQIEAEEAADHRLNRERLYDLLRSTGDSTVELYGVWDGDFAQAPLAFESISAERILSPEFRLKEQGFYKVHMTVSG
jgi:DICT domain-containing protein